MVSDETYRVVREELSNFVERIENLNAQIDEYKEMQKEVYNEAKSRGYETKIIRKIISIRKKDRQLFEEEQALLDLYLSSIE